VTIGGALLFAAAIAWFGYCYGVVFARPAPGPPHVPAIVRDIALFTVFALHHSVFARTPIRRWVASRAAPLERSIYVWVASALFIALCAMWREVGGVAWDIGGAARWGLGALQFAGLAIAVRAGASLDVRELAGLTPARPSGPPEFTNSGPYGWVRHPIYLGWCLIVLAVTPMTMTRLVFAVTSCLYLVIAIPIEEGTLRRSSGDAYGAYARQVRWRLVPGLY
jgi:protein-S-isoprenylcysteine O-methyltransferase Ste14